MEQTFIMIKPDGVQRGLIGEIIKRLEQKGFNLIAMKTMNVSRELAEKHYDVHRDKPFFSNLVEFIISAPVVAMVWEGEGIVAATRKMVGETNPLNAELGTIRGDYGISIGRNLIHASDAVETAQREIALWFEQGELTSWQGALQNWIYE